ncbi:MAG: hypothetical protein HKO91_02015 [Desulfobacterales bacterium]|nr:hypothetical protein [Desulfobacterales bacterium]
MKLPALKGGASCYQRRYPYIFYRMDQLKPGFVPNGLMMKQDRLLLTCDRGNIINPSGHYDSYTD